MLMSPVHFMEFFSYGLTLRLALVSSPCCHYQVKMYQHQTLHFTYVLFCIAERNSCSKHRLIVYVTLYSYSVVKLFLACLDKVSCIDPATLLTMNNAVDCTSSYLYFFPEFISPISSYNQVVGYQDMVLYIGIQHRLLEDQ
jgi:hypothetical protein